MEMKKYDKLTIDNKEYVVAHTINYNNKLYYYLTNLEVNHDLKFVFIEENEFYEVQDSKLIFDLFAEIAKENMQ